MLNRAASSGVLSLFALFALFGCSDDGEEPNEPEGVTLADPSAVTEGKTQGEWAGAWWNWLYSNPASANPALDETGEFADGNQTQAVFFLAGTFGGASMRSFTVPADEPIFFPIITFQADNCGVPLADQLTSEELEAYVDDAVANVTELELEIDGHSFASTPADLADHRLAATPMSYVVPAEDSLYDLQGSDFEGACAESYTSGYFVTIEGLPTGEHTLHFRALVPASDSASEDFVIDVTDAITAE